jgi:hypothetical protein
MTTVSLTNNARTDFEKCSFCGKPKENVSVLVTGDNASICEVCIVNTNVTLLQDTGIHDTFSSQLAIAFKKINKRLIFILLLTSLAFVVIIATTIFGR